MITQELRAAVVATNNFSAQKFIGMGFTLHDVDLRAVNEIHISISARFSCVCGRQEAFSSMQHIEALRRGHFNIYRELDRLGSMDRVHLLEDGYTVEQIDAMMNRLADHLARDGRWEIARPVSFTKPYG